MFSFAKCLLSSSSSSKKELVRAAFPSSSLMIAYEHPVQCASAKLVLDHRAVGESLNSQSRPCVIVNISRKNPPNGTNIPGVYRAVLVMVMRPLWASSKHWSTGWDLN